MDPVTIGFGLIAFAVIRGLTEEPRQSERPKGDYYNSYGKYEKRDRYSDQSSSRSRRY